MKHTLIGLLTLGLCTAAFAASFSGTLNPPPAGATTSSQTWNGTVTGIIGDANVLGLINPPCDSTTCDIYNLNVNVPATFYGTNPNYAIHINVSDTPNQPENDIDLYIYDAAGNLVCSGLSSDPTAEDVDCGPLTTGTYQVQVVPAACVNQPYNGQIILEAEPASTIQHTGLARYRQGKFTFSSPVQLTRPESIEGTSGVFLTSDGEPRVVHDALGNLYAAATQAVPAGTDFWNSLDGGATWNYQGEPDSAAAAQVLTKTNGYGLGGGDEDLIALPNFQLDVSSLWLGSNTTCVSSDQGALWACNPNSNMLPADDRQWLANYGSNIVYLTTKQIGTVETGPETIYVAKSTDGGLTFPTVSLVTTPATGVQPGDEGNMVVDSNGNVYLVFFDPSGQILYLAKSIDGAATWTLHTVYSAPACTPSLCISLAHVFASVAVDKANNLYIVFSDGTNSYYTSSTDGGASWRLPTIVQSAFGIKSSVEPWVVAGDAGKINIFLYGTTARNFMDNTANWIVYMSQSQNALAKVPTFSIAPATPYVIHTGAICNNGTACPSGTRTMLEYFFPDTYIDGNADAVFPDSVHVPTNPATETTVWFIKQTSGNKISGQ